MSEQEFCIEAAQLIKECGGAQACLEIMQKAAVPRKLKKSMKLFRKALRTIIHYEKSVRRTAS